MKNKLVLVLAFAFMIIVFSYSVSAHFVCGQVLNSPDNTSASWSDVRIFYPSNPLKFTTCQVSPQDNKYCCDAEAIPGKTWKIGNIVSAEVYEPYNDLVAGPVSVVTTGEAYDVFPIMQLEKVIEIHKPNSSLIISNNSNIFFNASFLPPYSQVSLNNQTLCNNCSNFSGNVNASFGDNNFQVSASDSSNSGIFYKNLSFTLIKDYNFTRQLECDSCRGLSVRDGSVFTVVLKINLSGSIHNEILTESVPSDFKILNTTGSTSIYSSDYNTISWNVSGDYIEENYTLQAPSNFWASNYEFTTELGGNLINSEDVKIFRLISLFPIKHEKSYYRIPTIIYPRISGNQPYVIHNYGNLVDLAFFPNNTVNNAQFQVLNWTPSEKVKNAMSYYLIKSNLNRNEWGNVYVDFKINKSSVDNSSEISLMSFDGNSWNRENVSLYNQDNDSFYFKGFITGNAFAIVNNKTERQIPNGNVFLGFRGLTGNAILSGNQTAGNFLNLFNSGKPVVGKLGAFVNSLEKIFY